MKLSLERLLRWSLKSAIGVCLWAIWPRMTLWALYCIFSEVWSNSVPKRPLEDGTMCGVPHEGGVETETWGTVCDHLSKATKVCEAYESYTGLGCRSAPFVVNRGGESNSSGGVTITCGETTCREWIKTTDKFPLLIARRLAAKEKAK